MFLCNSWSKLWLFCKGTKKAEEAEKPRKVPQTPWSRAISERAPGPKVGVKGPAGPTLCAKGTQGRQTYVGRGGT